MENASGNYDISPWMQAPPVRVSAPRATYEATVTGEALSAAMGEPAESVRLRRPPLPLDLFPPRFGYSTDELRIEDVVRLDDIYERRDFSGRKSGYEGTSTPANTFF